MTINNRTGLVLGFLAALSLILSAGGLHAQENGSQQASAEPSAAKLEKRSFSREHSIRSSDGTLRYIARGEDVFITGDEGNPVASFFTLSYTLKDSPDPASRPVTFIFNGGPGAGSLWLHLGLVGPKTLDIPSDAQDPGAPPYSLKDNPATLLRATDLVFVDPVGTGYSRALGDKENEDFWGYTQDADSVAEFIRTWITANDRWNSPKYVMGESYGGIRAGLLLPRLQQDKGIALNGVLLIAPALNMGTLPFYIDPVHVSYVTQLPAYAAAAWYHEAIPERPQELTPFLEEVEEFARTDYLMALFQGNSLSPERKRAVAERLHRYTGLSTDYILKSDLRIYVEKFRKELLRDRGLVVGRLDARYVQQAGDATDAYPSGDPSNSKPTPIYAATFQSYLRDAVGIDLVEEYVGLSTEANQSWKRPESANNAFAGYVNVTPNYAEATRDNSELRIFVASGDYDLVTTSFAIRSTLDQSDIDPGRLTVQSYPAGHMMYLHQPTLAELSEDLVAFIRQDGE